MTEHDLPAVAEPDDPLRSFGAPRDDAETTEWVQGCVYALAAGGTILDYAKGDPHAVQLLARRSVHPAWRAQFEAAKRIGAAVLVERAVSVVDGRSPTNRVNPVTGLPIVDSDARDALRAQVYLRVAEMHDRRLSPTTRLQHGVDAEAPPELAEHLALAEIRRLEHVARQRRELAQMPEDVQALLD